MFFLLFFFSILGMVSFFYFAVVFIYFAVVFFILPWVFFILSWVFFILPWLCLCCGDFNYIVAVLFFSPWQLWATVIFKLMMLIESVILSKTMLIVIYVKILHHSFIPTIYENFKSVSFTFIGQRKIWKLTWLFDLSYWKN